jgi:hypothetical protein
MPSRDLIAIRQAGLGASGGVRAAGLLLVLLAGARLPAAESLEMIGKWSVDSIIQPDQANPNRTCTVHPKPGSMSMTIDHATITTAVMGTSTQAQLDKERYEILEETPSRVLIRVLSAKPYNITISQAADGALRWTTATFVISLVHYDAQAISRQLAQEAHAAQLEATIHAPPVADQPLRGTFGGQAWSAVCCVASPVQLSTATIRCAILAEAPDAAGGSSRPKLLLELPTKPGSYPLGATSSVTFCIPPANNLVASDGVLVVSAVSAQELAFALSVRFDADNQVNGRMRLLLTPPSAK